MTVKLDICKQVPSQLMNSIFRTVPMFVTIFYVLLGPGLGMLKMYPISNLTLLAPMVR